ncbi:N-acyl-D-amino-acid deacylase family protein [Sphingomonas psychrotolerans]|uniref:N-acyl-D-amino acid deacylase n=1 Tax=Sphingomonas psychrotolerans TaxID=1327635 RepID=A0A2K8MMP2_9SPHN|nr:amidohydrolase family protein [Sphingomonas psychrotolerans]ATY33906.1 N-acyl-D-amino acid deacylase [Sphingomonas psychrotolerans]
MSRNLTRRQLIGGAVAAGGLASWPGRAAAPAGSTLFREVLLVDGTGAPPRLADVLVTGDRIARITAPAAQQRVTAARIVAGEGRILAPGFIDTHSHGDPLENSYESFLAMGVTTITLGQDGSGPRLGKDLDLRSWMNAVDRARIDVNVATLSSHGTLRRAANVSDAVRHPDDAGLARMAAQLEAELRAGAFGLSYGLEYVPGIYSETRELTHLGRVVSRRNGVVMSHMRSENDAEIEGSIDELIASSLPARPHISHLKLVFGKGEQRARALLDFLAAKRRAGIDLTADAYPYTAGYTGVAILFPEWALPPGDYAAVLAGRRQELRDYLEKRMIRRGGPEALLLGTAPHAGKTVAQAAAEAGLAFPDFLVKLGPEGGSGAHFTMDKTLQDVLLVDPHVAISTDGGPGMRHPRATGTYAKLIEDYVVRDARLPIEQAIRKATGFPARILRLADRGVIRVGARADLIVFDPAKVKARSTYVDPFARAEGFDLVMINGRPAFEHGTRVDTPGRLLRSSTA